MTKEKEFNPGANLCQTCERRPTCNAPCEFLNRALHRFEGKKIENVLSPLFLQKLMEEREEYQTSATPEDVFILKNSIENLPPTQRKIADIMLQGQAPTSRLARQLGLSRRTLRTHVERIMEKTDGFPKAAS